MLPEAHICHRTPDRIRIKIPARKGDAAYFAWLRDQACQCPGVTKAEVNAVTGSVLLSHQLDIRQLAEFAAANHLFSLEISGAVPKTLNDKVVDSFRDLNGQIKGLSGNELDIPSIAFVGLLGIGIYELSMGNFVVPFWHTAFWYAMSIVLNSRSDKSDRER